MNIPPVARLPHLYFGLAWIVIRALGCFPFFYLNRRSGEWPKIQFAMEAGENGWRSIELKELALSAEECFGEGSVCRLTVDRQKDYVRQVRLFLENNRHVTHYLYDPRAGRAEADQTYLNCFTDSLRLAIIFARRRITPIVYLTDASYRKWRCQASVVSSVSGIVTMFMSFEAARPMLPHDRFFGPSLMPLSARTLGQLKEIKQSIVETGSVENVVRFSGSLYEPRATFLGKFKEALGEKCDIQGRSIGSARRPEEWYWRNLASAAIVITTAEQIEQDGADMPHIQQMVYRCTEALAVGAMLLAPDVPGMGRYYEAGKHFVAFESVGDACAKARYYLENPAEAQRIARQGHRKAAQLITDKAFWSALALRSKIPAGQAEAA